MISRSEAEGAAGFTLFELLIVLLLMALVAAALVSGGRPGSPAMAARAAGGELASALRLARAQASATNRPVGLALDVVNRRYRVGTEAPRALPGSVELTLHTARSDVLSRNQGLIRFNPDEKMSEYVSLLNG